MNGFCQGDIIKVSGFKNYFLVVSKNAFIKCMGVFHACPILNTIEGPLHIPVVGKKGIEGVVVCEQVKILDPKARNCRTADRIDYASIMNISDALQGIFEYD